VALAPGTRLGAYEILMLLGRGGMGEVYRARDTKLERDVAIKILPELFVSDPERVARFQREAKTLAALNHPHIGSIYGLEDAQGVRALVLELVEGPTLADRIAQGPIPLDEALPMAQQIAQALEAAHDAGIIHRDLKPANIKLRPDGTVKVLDFGLAKAMEPTAAWSPNVTQSPTITTPAMMTGVGMILGTAAYMSPEQAKGRPADKRSDIWAFGCVLYETLTGMRAFDGDDVSETLAAVLRGQPAWEVLPSQTPRSVMRLLRRCLAKERTQRLADMADAQLDLHDAHTPTSEPADAFTGLPRGERRTWVSALVVLTISAATLTWFLRPTPRVPEMRLEIATQPTDQPSSLAISPDGQKLVFAAISDGRAQLWLRPLNSVSARPLPGTANGIRPFWSPDGRSIAFFADNQLKRIDPDSNSVQKLANATIGFGGTWIGDTILFSAGIGPILRVPAGGGTPEPVNETEKPSAGGGYRLPQFLPDGRHFFFMAPRVGPRAPERAVHIGELGQVGSQQLLLADSGAIYGSDHLFFVRQGTLYAQRFDTARLRLRGAPIVVANQVFVDGVFLPAVSVSPTGTIVYRSNSAATRRQFVWFDRQGKVLERVGEPDNSSIQNPAMSPDGSTVAFSRMIDYNTDIWLLDVKHGRLSRFTSDAAPDQYPLWSPDGSRIVFSSIRGSGFSLFEKPSSGTSAEELLLTGPGAHIATDWSRDGQFLLYHVLEKTNYDIWAMRLDDRKPFPVARTEFNERDGQLSPDGRWVAYHSDESARYEVYVQPFPVATRRWGPISANGGAQVRWRGDGKELFYLAPDNRLMAVPVNLDSVAQAAEFGTPTALFTVRTDVGAPAGRQPYVAARDGQSFLVDSLADEGGTSITVILNWNAKQ
jgi:serine/threonine protein kinase